MMLGGVGLIKNLPLLLAMVIAGCSAITISSTVEMLPALEWILRAGGLVLGMWGMMALILHVGIYKLKQ
jgi:hypothetical protein